MYLIENSAWVDARASATAVPGRVNCAKRLWGSISATAWFGAGRREVEVEVLDQVCTGVKERDI
jgi:hypothetical protein